MCDLRFLDDRAGSHRRDDGDIPYRDVLFDCVGGDFPDIPGLGEMNIYLRVRIWSVGRLVGESANVIRWSTLEANQYVALGVRPEQPLAGAASLNRWSIESGR